MNGVDYTALKKKLAQVMWTDKVTISRQVGKEDEEGADDYTVETVAEAVPCHLSIYTIMGEGDQTDRADEIETRLRLYCSPSADIRANDILDVVQTATGQHFLLRAGKAFDYPSHKEVNCKRVKEEA